MKSAAIDEIRERLDVDYMQASQYGDDCLPQAVEDVAYLLGAYDAAAEQGRFYIRLYVDAQRRSLWTHVAAALAGATAVGVTWLT